MTWQHSRTHTLTSPAKTLLLALRSCRAVLLSHIPCTFSATRTHAPASRSLSARTAVARTLRLRARNIYTALCAPYKPALYTCLHCAPPLLRSLFSACAASARRRSCHLSSLSHLPAYRLHTSIASHWRFCCAAQKSEKPCLYFLPMKPSAAPSPPDLHLTALTAPGPTACASCAPLPSAETQAL